MKKIKRKKVIKKQKSLFKMIAILMAIFGMFILTIVLLSDSVKQQDTEKKVSTAQKHQFFDKIKVAAQNNQKEYGVFASITMAQAALESNFGTSQLATKYYNLFGVKGNEKNGVKLPTLEYINGSYQQIEDYFVIYSDWDASVKAHGKLLYNGTSWNVNQYKAVLIAKNYQDAARGLVTGGYASDPAYAEKIMTLIEQYKLNEYDNVK